MAILGWIYLKAGISQAVRMGFCPGHQFFSVLGGKYRMPTDFNLQGEVPSLICAW